MTISQDPKLPYPLTNNPSGRLSPFCSELVPICSAVEPFCAFIAPFCSTISLNHLKVINIFLTYTEKIGIPFLTKRKFFRVVNATDPSLTNNLFSHFCSFLSPAVFLSIPLTFILKSNSSIYCDQLISRRSPFNKPFTPSELELIITRHELRDIKPPKNSGILFHFKMLTFNPVLSITRKQINRILGNCPSDGNNPPIGLSPISLKPRDYTLHLLLKNGVLTISELIKILGRCNKTISRHLIDLENAGLIVCQKDEISLNYANFLINYTYFMQF